jgi:hypothetical protein
LQGRTVRQQLDGQLRTTRCALRGRRLGRSRGMRGGPPGRPAIFSGLGNRATCPTAVGS